MSAAGKPKTLKCRVALFVALAAVLVFVSAGVVYSLAKQETPPSHEELLLQTEKVVLVTYNPRTVRRPFLEDAAAIRQFTGKMRLVPRGRCECSFAEHLEFHTPRGVLEVRMSDHNLTIGFNGKSAQYEMPEDLWDLYQARLADIGYESPK